MRHQGARGLLAAGARSPPCALPCVPRRQAEADVHALAAQHEEVRARAAAAQAPARARACVHVCLILDVGCWV